MRGAVLAGGAARRYGGLPKGLEEIGGRRILDRVADAVAAATGAPPLLVANDPRAPSWRTDLRTVPDVRPGCGSLGGIYSAVLAGPDAVLCVAWDMPFVTPELLVALAEGFAPWDAFLPESGGRRGVEPLCAVYGPPCAPAIERRGARGGLEAPPLPPPVGGRTPPPPPGRPPGAPEGLSLHRHPPGEPRRAGA